MDAFRNGYRIQTALIDFPPHPLYYLLVVSIDGDTLFSQEYSFTFAEEELMSIGLSYTEML